MLKASDKPAEITVRKLQLVNNDYVNILKDLRGKNEYRFIIDCKLENVRKFLHAVSIIMK